MAATQSSHKRRWGQLAYVATTLRLLADVECVPFHIEADGVGHDFEAALILVANCGEIIPPLFKLGQNVSPYDGMLDVIMLSANSVGGGVRALWHVVREAKGVYGKTVFAARVSGARNPRRLRRPGPSRSSWMASRPARPRSRPRSCRGRSS